MSSTTIARLNVLLTADAKQLTQGLRTAQQRVGDLGKRMSSFGKTLSTRVSLPLAAVGAASLKMAADAEEAANKFDVVFGGSADDVRQRLEALTATIPLTSSEMQGLAAGVQDLLVPMGVARNEAAGMSAQMVELAGDLGSFNNVGTEQVLQAMQSALAGSSEPMRRFGVDTREAALQAIALEHGLIDAGETMGDTARAQAVLIAIQEDSTDAIGDAARTVDSTSNSMRFLLRNIRQMGEDIGGILIPIITPWIQRMRDLVGRFQELSPGVQKAAVVVGVLAAAAGPLLITLGAMGAALGVLLGPVGLVAAAIAGLGTAAFFVVKHWDFLLVQTNRVWRAIKDLIFRGVNNVLKGMELIVRFIPKLGDAVRSAREGFDAFAEGSIAGTTTRIAVLRAQMAAQAAQLARTTEETDAAAAATTTLGTALGNAGTAVATTLTPSITALDGALAAFEPKVARTITRLNNVPPSTDEVTSAFERAAAGVNEMQGQIEGSVRSAGSAIGNWARSSGRNIKSFVRAAIAELVKLIAKMLAFKAITAIFDTATGGFGGAAFGAIGGIFGFQHGGSFRVGGSGGPDSQLVAFAASPGENVTVSPPGGGGSNTAADILARMPPLPQPMTPSEAATQSWFRMLISELAVDGIDRGMSFAQ